MRTWFDDLGFPLPPIEARTGFSSSGRRTRNIAESWSQDGGKSFVIFVRPDHNDEFEVAAAIAHQMCRISVWDKDDHGFLFRHLAVSIGLRGRKSESPPGNLFRELVGPVLEQTGAMPSQAIEHADVAQKTRQTTRMVKVTCADCGYIARVSRKWLNEVGPPLCPQHGKMVPSN